MAGYYAPLPQFQAPSNALFDFRGLNDGIDTLAKRWKDDREKADWETSLAKASANGLMKPELVEMARTMGPQNGPNALFSAYNAQQQRAIAQQAQDRQERQFSEQMRRTDQQLRLQKLQEDRLSGTMQSETDLRRAQADLARQQADNAKADSDLMRGLMAQAPEPSPGMPTTPPPPRQSGARIPPPSPLAGPSLQPQSGDGFDPSMVRPIAETGPIVPQAPAQPAPNMVRTPFGTMPVERARQLSGVFALRGKNEAAKLMEKAIENAGLGKAGQNEIDKKAVDSGELASRLDNIMAKFKPEYQQLGTQLKMYGANTADWLGMGDKIPPADRAKLADYHAFRQDSMNNLSQYIKEVTGAAMGIQEEKRIRAGMPDPEKDGPTQFEAKLRNSIAQTKFALARYNYLAKQGYSVESLGANREKLSGLIKIEDMPKVINERGAALRQQISTSRPGMPPADIDVFVMKQLKQEFGI